MKRTPPASSPVPSAKSSSQRRSHNPSLTAGAARTQDEDHPRAGRPSPATNSSSDPLKPPGTGRRTGDEAIQESNPRVNETEDESTSASAQLPTLGELRKRMEEAMVLRQLQTSRSSPRSLPSGRSRGTPEQLTTRRARADQPTSSDPPSDESPASVVVLTASTDSTKTVKGDLVGTPSNLQPKTPSYPFPRMGLRLPRGQSQLSGPIHRPFTLLSPTDAPGEGNIGNQPKTVDIPASDPSTPSRDQQFLPSGAMTVMEDPMFPSPNLYDVALRLNAEPGLHAWWVNVVAILQEHYGVERATLAVPGDATDLENVPWGQKATFNVYGTEENGLPTHQFAEEFMATRNSEPNVEKRFAVDPPISSLVGDLASTSTKRPAPQSRHSFAGFTQQKHDDNHKGRDGKRARPKGPVRTISNNSIGEFPVTNLSVWEEDVRESEKRSRTDTQELTHVKQVVDMSDSASQSSLFKVFPVPQALEQEYDALIERTGIVSLFGRRKPVLLTREYLDDSSASHVPTTQVESKDVDEKIGTHASDVQGKEKVISKILSTPARSSSNMSIDMPSKREVPGLWRQPQKINLLSRGESLGADKTKHAPAYEEYEQPSPSPWSQSPGPSPAPRADPAQNPFFAMPAAVDEGAFAQDAPVYDYSENYPYPAHGVDRSKTVIHIPLVRSAPSKSAPASTLRFPIAVLSILSPLVPYPATLRTSLSRLLPHLTNSYSLAQQFSNLEARLTGPANQRMGQSFGIGGTFSDESSELELVAELSGQLGYPTGESSHSAHGSVHSLDAHSAASNRSSAVSNVGTPAIDPATYGFSPGLPPTPGRSGTEIVDSYFLAKKQKASNVPGLMKTKVPGPYAEPSESHQSSNVAQHQGTAKSPQSTHRQRTFEAQLSGKTKSAVSQRPHIPSLPTSPRKTSLEEQENDTFAELAATEVQTSQQDVSAFRHPSTMSTSTQITRDTISRPLPDLISQLMLNSIPLQLFMAKPRTGELVWTNTKFDAYRSQGQKERVRDPWQNVHPEERQGLAKGWSRVLRTGSQMTQHVRVKRFNNDSDYRWFIFRASTLLNQNGELLYWIGSFLDVHEQRLAEMKAAHEKESFAIDAKYRALAKSIPQVLFEAVEDVGITSVNEQWPAFSGQSMDDAMNLGFAKHVHPDDLEKCGLLAPAAYAFEFGKHLLPTSEAESIHPRSPNNESGSVSESSHSSNKTVQANKQGAAEDSAAGTPPLHPPTLRALIQRGVVAVEEDENGKVSYSTEIRLRSKGGEFRWHLVRLNKAESKSVDDGSRSWYGTCTDINDRKGLERDLNNTMLRLNQEMEGKTKFFSNMSHEIRTPLNGILGIIPFLIDTNLDIDQRRMLDTIQNSSANLRELVDNILDVSKVEAGKMTLAPNWFYVRALLEEVIDTISSRAIEKRLELNYMVDLVVPSQVYGDRFRIRQILINLIGNAVKFTDQGEVFAHCTIETKSQASADPGSVQLAFEVVDTGKGFSQDDVQRLFQQFSQIASNNTQQAGSGLGLFLSKQLVEMHGGKLTPTSRPEEGATFRFTVKVDIPSEDNKPTSPSSKPLKRQFSSVSDTGASSPHSGPEKNPLAASRFIQSPGSARLTVSPGQESPALLSSGSSDPSVRSMSNYRSERSSLSSMMPTPESVAHDPASIKLVMPASERQIAAELAMIDTPISKPLTRKGSVPEIRPDAVRQTIYSIVVICPESHARAAIKQHIEQVVPHQIAANVTTIANVDEWVALMSGPSTPMLTHVVLDLPETHDVEDFMRQTLASKAKLVPSLIIITDHYQKRNISEQYKVMIEAGRSVYLVSKPVKPSIFSLIFDPTQQRDLSKDRNRDLAQTVSDSFKSVAKMVKDAVGGKGYRVLVVEDNATNRGIIIKYLNMVKLNHETAKDGLECTNMVFANEPGYYSLIICDIEMPIKNGYEACSDIRAWEAKKRCAPHPIMALSANAMTEQMDKAAQAGFTDYVTKPVVYNEFGKIMMNLLDPRVPHTYLRERTRKT